MGILKLALIFFSLRAWADPLLPVYSDLVEKGTSEQKVAVFEAFSKYDDEKITPKHVELLAKGLMDKDAPVRLASVNAVRAIWKYTNSHQPLLITPLLAAFSKEDKDFRVAAAWALSSVSEGHTFTDSEFKLLLTGTNDSEPEVVKSVLWTVSRARERKETREVLLSLLSHSDESIREKASDSLTEYETSGEEAGRILVAAYYEEKNKTVRINLMHAVSKAPLNSEVESVLFHGLADIEGGVRIAAARFIGMMGEKAAGLIPRLSRRAESGGGDRLEAARALMQMRSVTGAEQAIASLHKAFSRERTAAKTVFAAALLALGDPEEEDQKEKIQAAQNHALRVIKDHIKHEEWDLLDEWLRMFVYGGKNAAPLVTPLLDFEATLAEDRHGINETSVSIGHFLLSIGPDVPGYSKPPYLTMVSRRSFLTAHVPIGYAQASARSSLAVRKNLLAYSQVFLDSAKDEKLDLDTRERFISLIGSFDELGADSLRLADDLEKLNVPESMEERKVKALEFLRSTDR